MVGHHGIEGQPAVGRERRGHVRVQQPQRPRRGSRPAWAPRSSRRRRSARGAWSSCGTPRAPPLASRGRPRRRPARARSALASHRCGRRAPSRRATASPSRSSSCAVWPRISSHARGLGRRLRIIGSSSSRRRLTPLGTALLGRRFDPAPASPEARVGAQPPSLIDRLQQPEPFDRGHRGGLDEVAADPLERPGVRALLDQRHAARRPWPSRIAVVQPARLAPTIAAS